MRDQRNKEIGVVHTYYRPPDQGRYVDGEPLSELVKGSNSWALILLGDFIHPEICWKCQAASCKQFRRLLECIEDKFLTKVLESPSR